ncbi:hypothetical protein [Pseudomonas brenneri]|uniref:hypothetical protein n=1 Tax=Pseudomonas brenneri TaxID=129817 RepID=UPI003B9F1D30
MREHRFTDEELDVWGDLFTEVKRSGADHDLRFSQFILAPWNYLPTQSHENDSDFAPKQHRPSALNAESENGKIRSSGQRQLRLVSSR